MGHRLVDVTLENLGDAPVEVRGALFWELDGDPPVEPEFEKEEWFSSILLEWGTCAKLAVEDDLGGVGFAQYAPPPFFPRLAKFRTGRCSADAIYLSYCFVVLGRRGSGLGTELVRTAARDLADRGYHAMEAIAATDPGADTWVLPQPFLEANGFRVIRRDRRYPLMRLDLRAAVEPARATSAAAIPVPAPSPA